MASCSELLHLQSGVFGFGVLCDGASSDSAVESTTTVQPNSHYELEAWYDGTTASLAVNGVLEVRESKTFNFVATATHATFGAGAIYQP